MGLVRVSSAFVNVTCHGKSIIELGMIIGEGGSSLMRRLMEF